MVYVYRAVLTVHADLTKETSVSQG